MERDDRDSERELPFSEKVMTKNKRGFASMDPEKQREIASAGGKKAHARGTAHRFTSESGRAAGAKGGKAASRDRDYMRELGRKGGKAAMAKRRGKSESTTTQD
jgi:general stress protein YciG